MDPTLIPRLAREAGFTELMDDCGLAKGDWMGEVQKLAALVAEEAAKIAERHYIPGHSVAGPHFALACAQAIRERFKP